MSFPIFLAVVDVSPALITPFFLLLLLIATMPRSPPRLKHLWDRFYPLVALGLAAVVAVYYLSAIPGGGMELAHTAGDYLSCICLVG